MSQKDDLKTLKRVRKGETQAFENIVRKYQRPLFVYMGNIIHHTETTEDLLQDVFITAFTEISRYNRFRSSFSTWLYRIARNRCLNELNRKKAVAKPDFPDLKDERTPSDDLLNKEIADTLNKALASLPFKERSIFILAEIEGLSYKDIAKIEQIKTGTVKSRLSRTRQKLKKHLQKILGDTFER